MLEFPYRQALLLTYSIGLHQVTSLGVVFLLAYLPVGHLCHAPPFQNPKYASDVNMPSQTK